MTNQRINTENGGKGAITFAVIGIFVLLLHFYRYCPLLFADIIPKDSIGDAILSHLVSMPLFDSIIVVKIVAIGMLFFYILFSEDKSKSSGEVEKALKQTGFGLLPYFLSIFLIDQDGHSEPFIDWCYIAASIWGFILIWFGMRDIYLYCVNPQKNADIFNKEGTSFPQEERLIETAFSVNLPAEYYWDGRWRKSWVNFVCPQRGIMILGSPGSGKSWFVIENMIRQFIEKGFAMFIYDYKYDHLTVLAYNHFLKYKDRYPSNTRFYTINFDDLSKSHRCNCIDAPTLLSIDDAVEASNTLFLGANETWAKKRGDFWVESTINFFAAVVWFLRKYEGGKYCTLPHAIELAHAPYRQLFAVLDTEPGIELQVNPYRQAFENSNMNQLDGQIVSAKIPLARLASPKTYYILSGNDFPLDINNPGAPKIFCLGGSSTQQEALAPLLSLYIDRLCNRINQPGKHPCALICDEFATVRTLNIPKTIGTGRSNDIMTVIATQDLSQLRMHYSAQEAEAMGNMPGSFVCGQVHGNTAKEISGRFLHTMQTHESRSQNSHDVSITESRHLAAAISPATLSNLSAGVFVGIVADEPKTPIENKAFHARIVNDVKGIEKEKDGWVELPVIQKVEDSDIEANFLRIRQEAKDIVENVLSRIANDPEAI